MLAFSMPERCCLSRRGKQYREKSRLFPGLFPGLFPRVFPRVFPGYFPDGFPKDFPAGLSGEPRRLPGRSPIKFPISAPAPPKNRRRRTAPARGPFAVCPHHRPVRNETQHPHPLLVGWGCVESEPKALAGGTAAPLLMGLGRVNTGPKALAGGTAAPPTATRLQWSCSPAACRWRSGGRRPCRC